MHKRRVEKRILSTEEAQLETGAAASTLYSVK